MVLVHSVQARVTAADPLGLRRASRRKFAVAHRLNDNCQCLNAAKSVEKNGEVGR